MSFRDELNSIRPDMKMISEQECMRQFFMRHMRK